MQEKNSPTHQQQKQLSSSDNGAAFTLNPNAASANGNFPSLSIPLDQKQVSNRTNRRIPPIEHKQLTDRNVGWQKMKDLEHRQKVLTRV